MALGIEREIDQHDGARGLARNVDRYKAPLEAADEPRRGLRDRQGNLTGAGLADFCRFFGEICIDQVTLRASMA